MDNNRVYTILESTSSNDEKRRALLEYLRYCMRKLPSDVNGRRTTAQNFAELLDTNYFADVDDGELKTFLRKASELRSDSVQNDASWNNLEEMLEDV